MFANNGAGSNNSRKRKIKESEDFAKTIDNLTFPFTSFTSLLLEDDDDDDQYQIPNTQQLQDEQIDQLIKTHCDSLRRTLAVLRQRDCIALQRAADDRAAKRMREKELELDQTARKKAELEQMAAHFRKEAQVWQSRAREMEQTAESLREVLRDATMRGGSTDGGWRLGCAGCRGPGGEEDAESSYVDPEREIGDPTWQACKACGKRVGTVMMWPCRHVSVCVRCEGATKVCPVCLSPKTASVEVLLP